MDLDFGEGEESNQSEMSTTPTTSRPGDNNTKSIRLSDERYGLLHSVSIVVDPVDSGLDPSESPNAQELNIYLRESDEREDIDDGSDGEDELEPAVDEVRPGDGKQASGGVDDGPIDGEEALLDRDELREELRDELRYELEDGDCLSSKLAKRVVIVDEADKMLLLRSSATPTSPAHQQQYEAPLPGSKADKHMGLININRLRMMQAERKKNKREISSGLQFGPDNESDPSLESAAAEQIGEEAGLDSKAEPITLRERRLKSLAAISFFPPEFKRENNSAGQHEQEDSNLPFGGAKLRIDTNPVATPAPAREHLLVRASTTGADEYERPDGSLQMVVSPMKRGKLSEDIINSSRNIEYHQKDQLAKKQHRFSHQFQPGFKFYQSNLNQCDQDSLEQDFRGEREFNEQLRKGSPVDNRNLGEKLHQQELNTRRQARSRQSIDFSAIASIGTTGCSAQTSGGQTNYGRRLTVDAGTYRAQQGQLDSQTNSECETSGCSNLAARESLGSALRNKSVSPVRFAQAQGRRVSFGKIGDQNRVEAEFECKSRVAQTATELNQASRANQRPNSPALGEETGVGGIEIGNASTALKFTDSKFIAKSKAQEELDYFLKLTRDSLGLGHSGSESSNISKDSDIEIDNNNNINNNSNTRKQHKRYSLSSAANQDKGGAGLVETRQGCIISKKTTRCKSITTRNHLNQIEPNTSLLLTINQSKRKQNLSNMEKPKGFEDQFPAPTSPIEMEKQGGEMKGSALNYNSGCKSQVTSTLSSPGCSNKKATESAMSHVETNTDTNDNTPVKDNARKNKKEVSVESIMANAKLRQEEFARLLDEHEQIVNEINRVETEMSTSQSSLLQHQESNNNKDDQVNQ